MSIPFSPGATPFWVADRLALFPDSTRIQQDRLYIGGCSLVDVADQFQTPLYVYDQATLDACAVAYKGALQAYYPAMGKVTYAGKAFLCRALARWTQRQQLWVDCTGEGELAIAVAGNVPRQHILVHGVNKSRADLKTAWRQAGTIVIDNLSELELIVAMLPELNKSTAPQLWLRLLPGLAVNTHHAHTQTGQHASKFGMTAEELLQAAAFCKANGLKLNGLHFHQGSNFRDPAPLLEAIELGLQLAKQMDLGPKWHFSPGGGWGIAYHEDELPQPDIDQYVQLISSAVVQGCSAQNLPLPDLHLEPGRSLVARAGVAIYRVGAIKTRGEKHWILTDGGMTDNPRHALYGARYSCLPLMELERQRGEPVSIAGPYCESGDVVIEDLPMPSLKIGELIAIPASGAYHLSMSSNYNGARRPAVVWLNEGQAQQIIRRETIEDLLQRDL